ncbi:N4 vRNAP-like protein [Roseovarius Plymouth podovirus 1]|uniref:N4 vRNAP-like protein n=1 Tax=Roseovarius Plymouth podovirus 1 TaxID=926474 RepID=K4Q5A1_9CAUD|nr:virion RNA polymerase [Roseovarius Plymouth podovirus 1]CBX87992.1 N4 vRNAP-like protein [Roseovarius Plymouth podovirus 1]
MNDRVTPSVDEEIEATLAQAPDLRDRQVQDTLAVANKRGNDLADTELSTDLREMSVSGLRMKYGDDVANNRHRLVRGEERLNTSDDVDTAASDLFVSASTGAYRSLGQAGILADSYARAWLNPEGGSGAERAAPLMQAHAEIVAGMQEMNLSDELQGKRYFEGIEGQLDEQDSEAQYQRDIEAGKSETIAKWQREGRNAVNAGQRYLRDPGLLSNTIAESVGDMVFTAPLGGVAGKAAMQAAGVATKSVLAQRVAGTMAISATTGFPELGNVYSETVTDVMGIETEKLLATSPVMQAMLDEDPTMTPEEAKVQLAGLAAETALLRQVPSTMAIGFITSRFEALGPLAFRGQGVASNLLQIAGEGVEELGQEGTSVYNRNIAVEDYAAIGRDSMEGVGTGAGVGFVAGVGTAGTMGAPAVALGTARNAANALFAETAPGEGSRASRAADATGRALAPVGEAVGAAAAPVARAAGAVVNEGLNRIDDSTDNKEVRQNVQTTIDVTEALRTEAANGTIDPKVTEVIDAPDAREAPEGFSDVAGGGRNIVESLTGIMAKMGTRRFKPTDQDVVYAADMVNRLESIVGSLPQDQQKAVGRLMSTKMVKNIRERAAAVDLNDEGADTSTSSVVNVARTNPGNMNPDVGNNLLEDNERDVSPEDAKYIRVSSRLAEIINRNVESQAELSEGENISLKPGSRPKTQEKTIKGVSRQIFTEGRNDPKVRKGYRSINDFGRDLVLAAQAVAQTGIFPKDAAIINQKGQVVTAGVVAKELRNFAQHMVNKVTALNESAANNVTTESGNVVAPTVDFQALMNGELRTTEGNKTSIKGVWYSPTNEKSAALALQVEQDANALIDTYNLLLQEFPEFFDADAKPMENIEVAKPDPKPTGIEEVSGQETDEQNPQTQEQTETPTAIDETEGATEVEEDTQASRRKKAYENISDEALADQITFAEKQVAEARKRLNRLIARETRNPGTETGPIQKFEKLLAERQEDLDTLNEILNDRTDELPDNFNVPEGATLTAGEPQLMQLYHGTGSRFEQFDVRKVGKNLKDKSGLFFTNSLELARDYAKLSNLKGGNDPHVKEVAVDLQKPMEIDVPGQRPDQFWINNQKDLNGLMVQGGYDGAIVRGLDGEIMVVKRDASGVTILQQDIDQPTAVEEDGESRSDELSDEASDERSESEPEEGNEEGGESSSDEQEYQKVYELLTTPEMWPEGPRKRLDEQKTAFRRAARSLIKEYFGNKLARREKGIVMYPAEVMNDAGMADDESNQIFLSDELWDAEKQELTRLGKAVVIHEMAHIIDFSEKSFGDVDREISSRVSFDQDGAITAEFELLKDRGDWVRGRYDYAVGQDSDTQRRREIFAIISELWFSKDPSLMDGMNKAKELMEEVYGPRERDTVGTPAESTEVSEGDAIDVPSTTEEPGDGTPEEAQVSPAADENFPTKGGEAPVKGIDDLAAREGMNQEHITVARELKAEIGRRLNARLQRKVKNSGKVATFAEHFLSGKFFKQFKMIALMNPETQAYDNQVIEMATIAIVDFITSAAAIDPRKLDDTLEDRGLTMNDVEESSLQAILNGLPASQVKDQLASDFMRLMNRSENKDRPVNELEGLAQGFAAEMITIMDEMDIVSVDKIKLSGATSVSAGLGGSVEITPPNADEALTITVTGDKLTTLQQRIRNAGGERVTNTARESIFNDVRATYSIGEKIKTVPVKGERSDVRLSSLITKAVKKMQDTGHRANVNRGTILGALGEDGLEKWLGFVPDATTIAHPILRKSALGKNATVRLNIIEVNEIMSALGDNIQALIYYPVGITKVGRHQYQGPNPQANKLLRFFASPTWSTVDTNDKADMDGFWLGIAQASGLFKVEKRNETEVLSEVKEAFEAKFRPAVDMTKAILTGGEVDVDTYIEALQSDDPAVLGAIEAMASMELALESGETSFETSLSFELDGLTNGAANMMVNFGHGLIAAEEWENFNRIGLFLGKIGRTVNDYFGSKQTTDLYEQVAQRTDDLLAAAGTDLKPWQRKQRAAAKRLAWAFSESERVETPDGSIEYRMTRSSAKNPMTKVNYGSGVQGVASGVAGDMLLDFYEKAQGMGENQSYEEYFYPEIREDMANMGLFLPKNPDKNFVFPIDQVNKFKTAVQFTIGQALTDATREVLGPRIEQLNDMLVLVTNMQNAYVQRMYDKAIADAVKEAGVRSPAQLPRATFERIQKEMYQLTPIFRSDDQTLAIGGFDKKLTDMRVSSNMDEGIRTPARMPLPDDIGVKALPFMVIGSGDAMMMNFFFGSDNAPEDVLGVFDGLDVPVTKIRDYSPQINEAVNKSWKRDVLGMALQNFESFLERVDDPATFEAAAADVLGNFKKKTVVAANWKELHEQLKERYKENKARKKIIAQMQKSVDQMGGGGIGFSEDGSEWNRTETNARIELEMKDPGSNINDRAETKTPVTVSDARTVLKVTKWTQNEKQTVDILKPLLGDTRVIFGTLDQLNQWKWENMPDDGSVLRARGTYDAKNDIIYITTKSNETILHEMVHAATYGKVLEHYEGKKNPAVERLEDLARQFVEIESDNKAVLRAQSVMNRRFVKGKPQDKASAINEFMAYALSNQGVRRTLENEQANILKKISDAVVKLMRRIMGGVRQDMFSHTVFNTRVLFGDNDGGTGGGGVIVSGGGNNGDGGGNGGPPQTDDPFHNFTNYWINTLRDWIADKASDEQVQRTSLELANAQRVIDDLRQAGLLHNTRDQATFKAIYGIMLSEMKLTPQSRIQLTRVFQHILDNLDPQMFGEGTEANNIYSAVVNTLSDKDATPGHAVAVLFGLSQTSTRMKAVMEQIPQPTGDNSIQGTLPAFMQKMTAFTMQKLTASLDADTKPPKEVLDLIAATIVDHDVNEEYRVLSHITTNLENADNYVSGAFSSVSGMMREKNADVQASTRNTAVKLLMGTVTVAGTNLLSREGAALTGEASKRFVNQFEGWKVLIPFQELVTEMVGTDRQNERITALLDKINAGIAGMRQAFREDLPGILERVFQTPPSKEQWKSMFNTLAKTDVYSVLDVNNMQNSMKVMEERSTRQTMLNNIENEIRTKLNQSNADAAIQKGEQLANFMSNGIVGKMLMRNAYAIMNGLEGSIPAEVEGLLDRWISIKAIDVMDPSTREDVVQLWQNDPNAIVAIVTYLQQLSEQEEAKEPSNQARLNAWKGYIPNEGGKNLQIVVELDESEREMNRKGYKKLGAYTGDASSVFPKSYYISNVRRQGAYTQGALQNVANTYRGVDTSNGLSVTGNTAGYISNEDGLVPGLVNDQLRESTTVENDQENVMPVHAEDGSIQGFELSVSKDVMDLHSGREENLAVMMGAWAGRQVEESLAAEYNKTLADELKKVWDQRERGSESTFVDFKESEDPIHKDTWSLVPQTTKVYLENIFGSDGVMIPRAMINLSVGYREASITDMWNGKSRMPDQVQKAVRVSTERLLGRSAMRWLSAGEEGFQGIVATAKDIIVVRSLIVPAMNMRSNAIQLMNAGVPHKTMVKDFRSKLAEIEEYNNNEVKIKELQAQLLLAGNNQQRRTVIEDKIRVIEDLNKRMTIAPMIEAGAYKQLSEGITDLDVAITSGKLAEYMEKLADKLPVGGGIVKIGMVSKSTDMYKAANRATQYGDFLAKSIYYDHLIKQGVSESQAITRMNEEFVNFTPAPGRTRSYLERMGLLWFPSFKLRIAKIAMKQIRENPVRSLALNMMLPDIGSPIQDNIFQVMIEGRLDYATGMEMLFAAPELNPWYNLMLD